MKRILFLLTLPLVAQSPNPTLTAFLASDAGNRAAIYASIAGLPTPKMKQAVQFWPMTDIYCGYAQASGACLFSLAAAENVMAEFCPVVNGTRAPIVDAFQVNVDMWNWIANTTPAQTHRTEFDAIFNPSSGYIVTACPNVKVVINVGFTSGNLNSVCATLAGTPNPMTGPANLDTCLSTVATWLTISATNYSPMGYLAKEYGSELYYLEVMHEPLSANSNYSWTANAAAWETYVTDMATAVHAQCSACGVGMAFDRFEQAYYSTMAGATGVQAVGVDDYTTDVNNTTNGLGALLTIAANVLSTSRTLIVSEFGYPAWVPTGDTQAAGNAYEDVGNCLWMQNDFARQSTVIKELLWSANGASYFDNYYTAFSTTTCIFGGPGNGNDKQASGSYPSTFAAAAAAGATTNMLPFFTQLYSWPFFVATGAPYGI